MSNRFEPGGPAKKYVRVIDVETALKDAVKAALVEYDAEQDSGFDLRRAACEELTGLIEDDGVEIEDLYYHNRAALLHKVQASVCEAAIEYLDKPAGEFCG